MYDLENPIKTGRCQAVRLYSYILRHDGGFAPNPFSGVCTLACCKPVIRRTARPGDLVLGLTPKPLGFQLSYAMEVHESLTFDEYWGDTRFKAKRPQWSSPSRVDRVGDNCYEPDGHQGFHQHPSVHSNRDGTEDTSNKKWDLSGQRVLVGGKYWYFGKNSLELPPEFDFLRVGRGHRSQFSYDQIDKIAGFLHQLPLGMSGPPREWPDKDQSWSNRGFPEPKRCR